VQKQTVAAVQERMSSPAAQDGWPDALVLVSAEILRLAQALAARSSRRAGEELWSSRLH